VIDLYGDIGIMLNRASAKNGVMFSVWFSSNSDGCGGPQRLLQYWAGVRIIV
jgi:hypothetical protein